MASKVAPTEGPAIVVEVGEKDGPLARADEAYEMRDDGHAAQGRCACEKQYER